MSAIVNIVGRIGRDVEVRYTPQNTAVANIAIATDAGYKDNKQTQWWDVSLFGKQAESLAQYLTKGATVQITAKDVLYKTFEKRDGTTGGKLTAVALDVAFIQRAPDTEPKPKPAPRPADDMEDAIPF